MNTPDNKQSPEDITREIHTEEYQDLTCFSLRGHRLENLGYTKVISIEPSSPKNPHEINQRLADIIDILQRYKREIAILKHEQTTEIYQRAPGTKIPTAQKDYADHDRTEAIITFATSQIHEEIKDKLN